MGMWLFPLFLSGFCGGVFGGVVVPPQYFGALDEISLPSLNGSHSRVGVGHGNGKTVHLQLHKLAPCSSWHSTGCWEINGTGLKYPPVFEANKTFADPQLVDPFEFQCLLDLEGMVRAFPSRSKEFVFTFICSSLSMLFMGKKWKRSKKRKKDTCTI